jgi:hypothetical protein
MEVKLQNIYAINYAIQSKKEVNYKALFDIFESIKKTLGADYIIFLEKSPIVPWYITYRYDSRQKWQLQSESYKHDGRSDFATIFEELDIKSGWTIQKISLWNTTHWYFIIWKQRYDRNVTNVIANLVSTPINTILTEKYEKLDQA